MKLKIFFNQAVLKKLMNPKPTSLVLQRVVHNSTKPRLILDLFYLNQFLTVPKFKFEDIRSVKDLFQKGDYFFKFDIHKGYYHINILEPHVKYLAFSWIIDGQVRYFAYTVLVFGLSPAPFVFTKVVKVSD